MSETEEPSPQLEETSRKPLHIRLSKLTTTDEAVIKRTDYIEIVTVTVKQSYNDIHTRQDRIGGGLYYTEQRRVVTRD